jgi:hypothetical protein
VVHTPRDVFVLCDCCLGPLASNAARELDVAGEDGDPFGVESAQVGVLEAVSSSAE